MPKPHVHPSANCYQNHGCRCSGCRRKIVLYRERKASEAARNRPVADPLNDAHTRVRHNPLSQDELVKLRRMVGLPDDGPPPEQRYEQSGRPKKTREGAR